MSEAGARKWANEQGLKVVKPEYLACLEAADLALNQMADNWAKPPYFMDEHGSCCIFCLENEGNPHMEKCAWTAWEQAHEA